VPCHHVGLDKNAPFRCLGNGIGDQLFETVAGFLFRIRDVIELVGNLSGSFTMIMCSLARKRLVRSMARSSAFCAPSEPSWAISIFIYISRPSASACAKAIQ
jgi:hypothetical protein